MADGALKEILYGRNPVRECLRADRRDCRRLFLAEGVRRNDFVQEISALAQQRGCPVQTKPRGEISRLTKSRQHQGIALEAGPYPYATMAEITVAAREAGPAALVLLLDRLQDPQNVGGLLRTAEAVGVQGIVLPKRRAVAITPAVVKASAGACEHLPIAQETNLIPVMAKLKEAGLWIMGLEKHAQATLYGEVDWDRPLGIVVGSEGFGLRRLVRERCDGLVQLPMRGQIGSLNAAIAGSIVLYEIWNSRRRARQVE